MTDADPSAEPTEELTLDRFYDALEALERPVVTASEVARAIDVTQAAAASLLERLAEEGRVESLDVEADPVVWYPHDYKETQKRERVEVFPNRREVVVSQPSQFTRAQLSQFAHLVETNREGGYRYEVREEDVWQAPYDDLDALRRTMRQALGGRHEALEEWVEGQWARARKFRLVTHADGYVVLEASSPDLLGNVAQQHLDESSLRAVISDTEAWVAEDAVSTVKRTLYDAGYPVADERELEAGEPLDVELRPELREYQQDWVERFLDRKAGVLVGPPGSGKTVAALGVMAAIGGETLILVPGRELAAQWSTALVEQTSLTEDQVGEYHGGEKRIRPVTVATYRTAGMDRHRRLFDEREWGLIVYDEVHHIPSPIHRVTANLQTRHRLGLSATPVREDDREAEIFTLIGPPIGTDWSALFDAGFVAEPEVEIRYVPWPNDDVANEYTSAEGHERRQLAASNPAKADEVAAILREHAGRKALVFVEYLEQGDQLAERLGVPFVSGRTPHAERGRLFEAFRAGDREVLVVSRVGDEGLDLPSAEVAVAASGLGGSRRQGAQRAGRTMRPVGRALLYVLATRGTQEEEFARRRMRHLAGKGIRVREAPAAAWE
ncbi:MAG: DEAD/DEAH box helicase [Halobacteriales archaeon]|nr:DEAD/DEAH box helicase [Halobacteriales archaeon]